jgi:hemoglobin-like flavoprotein
LKPSPRLRGIVLSCSASIRRNQAGTLPRPGETQMTPQQVLLVRNSLAAASPQRNRLAGTFFAQLFARDPSLRFLFKGDLRALGAELYQGLAAITGSIDRLHPIVPALEWLAVRVSSRGVGERHFALITAALVATLEAGLGEAFTAEHREAWNAASHRVIDVMMPAIAAEPLAA